MSRNSAKPTNGTASVEPTTPKRTRTRLNTLIIYRQTFTNGDQYYIAVHNANIVAAYAFGNDEKELVLVPNALGAYAGMKTYVRAMRSELTPILVTKSIDADVVAAQADKYVVGEFLKTYIDRLTIKAMAQREVMPALETEVETAS